MAELATRTTGLAVRRCSPGWLFFTHSRRIGRYDVTVGDISAWFHSRGSQDDPAGVVLVPGN